MATTIKSPFVVKQHAISEKVCEELSDYSIIDPDKFSEEVKNQAINDFSEQFLNPVINEHFDTTIASQEVTMESYGVNVVPEHLCDSCVFSNGKWYRTKDIDFVTIVFLKDYLEDVNSPMDPDIEVYGGNLEFPSFNFNLKPERGTTVTFPAAPNFLNTFSKVKLGQLNILRIHHRSVTMFVYEPAKFQGNIETWFKDLT